MTEQGSPPPQTPQPPPLSPLPIPAPTKSGGGGKLAIIIIACVVVVLAIGSLAAALLLSKLKDMRNVARAVACQANLKSIGTAMASYRMNSGGNMPVIRRAEATPNGANTAPTAANQTDYDLGDPDAPANELSWEVLGDQAMQNVWLLVMTDLLPEQIFHCPSDEDWRPRPATAGRYGWTSPRQYSYGMQWPYATDAAGKPNPARLGSPGTPMLADRNPGGPVGESLPPADHPKIGMNYATASGGAFANRNDTSQFGINGDGDEIYTNAAGVAGGLPQGPKDTSITLSGR